MRMGIRRTTKRWIRNALSGSGALRLGGRLVSPRAVILGYHSILSQPEEHANVIGLGIIHSAWAFEKQMEMVARNFKPVSLSEIVLFLRGERPLPPRAIAVTFDDGYLDNFEVAEPILRRYGIPAAFYLTVNLIGTRGVPWFNRIRHAFATSAKREWRNRGRSWSLSGPQERNAALQAGFELCSPMPEEVREEAIRNVERDLDVEGYVSERPLMMNWDHARSLQKAGHIIGSHTLSHPNLAYVREQELVNRELADSKRAIERELASPVEHFSYPHPALNPQWTDTTVAATREAGYITAVTTDPGPVLLGSSALSLRRMIVPRNEEDFLWRLERTFLDYGFR
jgi:peptidoglycan/xylan/chitin deacetylase (PgdA/CDA1 family)